MNLLRIEDHTDERQFTHSGLEQAPFGVVTTSADGDILAINDRFAAMFRFDAQELIGQHVSRFVHPDDSMPPMQQRSERRYINGDGDVMWMNVTPSPVFGDGRAIEQIVWLFEDMSGMGRPVSGPRDLTEHRKIQAQREQTDRLNSLGRMAATIAHDFNNVLMGISPFVEVIRRGKSVETSLDHIGRAVKRGKRITDEILRFTHSSQPQLAPLDVEPWIESIAAEGRSLVPPSCQIETFVQSSDLTIEGDANQLRTLFTNLILNAREAMPQGGTLSIEVLRERPDARLPFGVVEHPERFAHCIVRDTGIGMSEELLRHIFEPLFTTRRNGIGLGLTVAHQIVQRHGGQIFVESTVDVGTAFHVFLPLA
ncbi:MAG TPA: ATP-binding protein [Thermoanaerobaculia bacterium]|nr:ATP-binding protein [Thermoanaerobaculia bacterium]